MILRMSGMAAPVKTGEGRPFGLGQICAAPARRSIGHDRPEYPECPRLAPFPPKRRQEWLDSILREMASQRAVTSRGKRNIRGVKKRTSNYGARKRGDPINQPCNPKPRILSN